MNASGEGWLRCDVSFMTSPPEFDQVRFKVAMAAARMGYREYNRGLTVLEKRLPRGWIVSPARPDQMINPKKLRDAIGYFDISLELWPGLSWADGNAGTVANLKALTLRALGDFEEARRLHCEILAAAKEAGDKVMQEGAEEGIRFCDDHVSKN